MGGGGGESGVLCSTAGCPRAQAMLQKGDHEGTYNCSSTSRCASIGCLANRSEQAGTTKGRHQLVRGAWW
jgi:hypothetical protein